MKLTFKLTITFLFILFFFSSCEKIFMEPNPKTDNISIYDEYWKLLYEKYAMWENPEKQLNKEEIHNYTRGLVYNQSISKDSLFGVFSYIIQELKDGHSYLESIDNYKLFSFYDIEAVGESNLDTIVVNEMYLQNNYKTIGKNNSLKYTLLNNGEIGFIVLRTWLDFFENSDIDTVLKEFEHTKGIVFDVRNNGGGDPFMATLVAKHFIDTKKYIGTEYFKTGPNTDDFSPQELYLKPADGIHYTKPIMILTNNLCFSATTTFISSLAPYNHIKFIGSKTGGGSGATADGYLANGWHWQLSTSEFIDWKGRHLDNGTEPDIHVSLNYDDTSKDELIERAIVEIMNQ